MTNTNAIEQRRKFLAGIGKTDRQQADKIATETPRRPAPATATGKLFTNDIRFPGNHR